MKKISEEKYKEALRIIREYEFQKKQEKLSIYKGCTSRDILVIKSKDFRNRDVFYLFVTKENKHPNRDPDGTIKDSGLGWFELEHSQTPYPNYDAAYKNLIITFKRKGYIK